MDKRFFDSFRHCVDTINLINRMSMIAFGHASGFMVDFQVHKDYVIEQLKGEISNEVFEIVGTESKGFVDIVSLMKREDRKLVLENVFNQLTERIDSVRGELSHFDDQINQDRLSILVGILESLAIAFKVDSPEPIRVVLGGQTMFLYDWLELKSKVLASARAS